MLLNFPYQLIGGDECGTYSTSPHITCVHCKLCLDLAHQLWCAKSKHCGLLQVTTSLLLHQVYTLQLRVQNVSSNDVAV